MTFAYKVRVAAISPPLPASNTSVVAWQWFPEGQPATGARLNGSAWSPEYIASFNGTAVPWDKISSVDYKILPTQMWLCPVGQPVAPNRTMSVQVSITIEGGGPPLLLESALLRDRSASGKIPRQLRDDCANLQIIIGRQNSTGTNFIETAREYNARRYWPVFAALPQPADTPALQLFPVQDRLVIADSDIGAWRDGLHAMQQLGLHGIGGVPRAWLMHDELGDVFKPMRHQTVALVDWQKPKPKHLPWNLTAWAEIAVGEELAAGFKPGQLSTVSMDDEPGAQLPAALPPVSNSTAAAQRWVAYLRVQGLQPGDLGAVGWPEVLPNITAGAMPDAPLADRRLRYWSVRHVAWDSSTYLASATRALEALSPGLRPYVNWNNFGNHMFYPYASGGGWLNNDWFEHARVRGGALLWTEDWLDDGMSFYWSYYAALMGGACRLAEPVGGTAAFGGYIVPRRSGAAIDGAMQRRAIALIGNGAKALTYYIFGPEYNYPGNCYSDARFLTAILNEQHEANVLIGRAEQVLWPAQKIQSKVAILAHRSSEIWDPPGATKWEDQQQAVIAYQADQFGLYLALAVHGGVPVDFIDEDAVANATVMSAYTVLFITQPNVPAASAASAAAWVRRGGMLVLSGGAAASDEYNTTMSTLHTDLTGTQLSPMPRLRLRTDHGNPGLLRCGAGEVLVVNSSHEPEAITACGANATFESVGNRSTVLATFATGGGPAVLQTPSGAGSVAQFAWQPGLSYLPNASMYTYIPNPRTQLPTAVRTLLVGLTKGAFTPPVRLALHGGSTAAGVVGMEATLLASSRGAVVTLLNWGGDAVVGAELEVHIDLPAAVFGSPPKVERVFSARSGQNLSHTPARGQTVTVVAKAEYAEFVVLLPARQDAADNAFAEPTSNGQDTFHSTE
jgi:hypothetical protein